MEGRLGAFIPEYTGYDSVLLCNFTGVWQEQIKGGYTLVTLPRIVTRYRDSVDGTRNRVTCQKLVTR